MEDKFSFSRMRLLIRRQWTESKRFLLIIALLIVLSIMIISLLLDKMPDKWVVFTIIFGLGGGFVVLGMFSDWTNFSRSSQFFMIPASVTEKFLLSVCFGILIYIPAFILLFIFSRYILFYLLVLPFPNNLVPYSSLIKNLFTEMLVFLKNPERILLLIIFSLLPLLTIQSVFIFYATRFRKYAAQLSILTIIAIIIAYNVVMFRMATWIVNIEPGSHYSISYPGFIPYDLSYFSLDSRKGTMTYWESFIFIKPFRFLHYGIWMVISLFLYLSSWSRLKEREL